MGETVKSTKQQAHALGQKIVELIAADCEKAGIDDLNVVFNVLVSVLAHYIGGINPHSARMATYNKVGRWLSEHLEQMERDGATHAQVIVEIDGGPLQ